MRAWLAVVAATLGVGVVAIPAFASDSKGIAPGGGCIAMAPDTTAGELDFTPSGIYNPGTTAEKVMCALPQDEDGYYTSGELYVYARYRVAGPVPAKMTCTLFVGSVHNNDTVTTHTESGELKANGARWDVPLVGIGGGSSAPLTLVCAIPPKTYFSSIKLTEHDTDVEPPN